MKLKSFLLRSYEKILRQEIQEDMMAKCTLSWSVSFIQYFVEQFFVIGKVVLSFNTVVLIILKMVFWVSNFANIRRIFGLNLITLVFFRHRFFTDWSIKNFKKSIISRNKFLNILKWKNHFSNPKSFLNHILIQKNYFIFKWTL